MPVFENHTGINFSENKLQLVELSYKNNLFYLENVDQAIFKENVALGIQEAKFVGVIHEAFNKIISKKPLNSKFVSFTLPNNYFNIFEIPYDQSLTKKDLVQHFKWELSILYPDCDKDCFLIQHIEVNKSSVRHENKAIVLALKKDVVGAINLFCKTNNLELKYVDNAHLASNAFLYMGKSHACGEIVYSIYIDQIFSSFAAIEGSNPFYFKVFKSSGAGIFDEFDLIIKKMQELKLNATNVKEVMICGQSITKEFEEAIKEKFGLPLKRINPFERLQIEGELKKSPHIAAQNNSFTAAAGIAIRII